jgi:hypothetical protein
MILKLAVLAIALSAPTPLFAQAKPTEASVTGLSESQHDKLMLAIKDFQLAQKNQQLLKQAEVATDKAVQDAQVAVEVMVAKAKSDMHLDDSYTFDYSKLQFVKSATAPAAAPAKK